MGGGLRGAVLGAACGAVLAVAGCGGSNRSAPEGSTPAQGGTTTTGGGGTGTGTSSGSSGGSGPGDSSSAPSGGSATGNSSDQGTGTASGGPAPSDPCAGLVPTPGAPVEVALDISTIPSCHLPTSDGSGTAVAIGAGLHHSGFDLYPMAGGGSFGSIAVDYQDTGPVYDALVPSTIGFQGAVGTGPGSTVDRGIFAAYDDHGAQLTTSYQGAGSAGLAGDARLLKLDPQGGGAALMTVSGPLQAATWNVEIVDAGGHRSAGIALDTVAWDLSVAVNGRVLVTAMSGNDHSWKARWLDHDAKPLTDWFPFQLTTTPPTYQVATYVTLEPLADGSIALREGDAWTLAFPNGVARCDPAPAWLATRAATEVSVVRGGKAMALTARGQTSVCGSDTFEVVTPTGQSCGTVQLTSAASCAHVAFGRDGTAFTLSIGSSPTSTSNQLCTYRWWPGLVR